MRLLFLKMVTVTKYHEFARHSLSYAQGAGAASFAYLDQEDVVVPDTEPVRSCAGPLLPHHDLQNEAEQIIS
jgi:hypothetical protein